MTDIQRLTTPGSDEPPVDTTEGNNDNENFTVTPPLSAEEIEERVAKANDYKAAGNNLFASGKFEDAIKAYEDALSECPAEKEEERAVYWGNIGACYMRMSKFKEAVHACTESLKLDSTYAKALLRRGQANERLGTYSSLTDSLEDFKALQQLDDLTEHMKMECKKAIQRLPPLIERQKEKEKEEMLGKLKELGNTVLGKFGLSTDNFKLQKDPNSSSYSLNFVQNQGSK